MQIQVLGRGEVAAWVVKAESDSGASLDPDDFKILDFVILNTTIVESQQLYTTIVVIM